jgi:hypothetical protein
MKAIELQLSDPAASVAEEFESLFPGVSFTSGLRTVAKQAADMATNVMLNTSWIAQTYATSRAASACQQWIDGATQPMTLAQCTAGLQSVLGAFTPQDLTHLSSHLSGQAFDVLPSSCNSEAQAWLRDRAAEMGGKFLTVEGNLVRFHFQCPIV